MRDRITGSRTVMLPIPSPVQCLFVWLAVVAIAVLDAFLWHAEMKLPMPYESPHAWALHLPFASIPGAFWFAAAAVLGARTAHAFGRDGGVRATFAVALLALLSFAVAHSAMLSFYSRFPGPIWFSAITGIAAWVLPVVGIPIALRSALGTVCWRVDRNHDGE